MYKNHHLHHHHHQTKCIVEFMHFYVNNIIKKKEHICIKINMCMWFYVKNENNLINFSLLIQSDIN